MNDYNFTFLLDRYSSIRFWHEIGHATSIITFTKEKARVILGPVHERDKDYFRVGRIYFHIKWSYSGYCSFKSIKTPTNSNLQKVMISAGGPIYSLLLMTLAYSISKHIMYNGIK